VVKICHILLLISRISNYFNNSYLFPSNKAMINIKWKKAFTLAEVIIVCALFSLMVIWIMVAINRAFIFLDNTRLSVRATNLAREWVEMMYNLRDSNRRKYSWERDRNRLNAWLVGSINPWIYTINETWNSNGDYFIYLSGLSVSDIETFYSVDWFFSDAFSGQRISSKLDFTGTYSYYSWWIILTWWSIKDLVQVDGLEFYRIARVFGIEDKPSPGCTNKCPQEMRFCVKVFYESQWQHASELCSIMTNFME
jgi:hypothetical protein